MIKKQARVGTKVYYQPDHYKKDNKYENGIVKEIPEHTEDSVRVVFNCAEDWDNYKNYTSALTNLRDLYLGWFKERTLCQLSTDIETAVNEIHRLLEIKYKEYDKLKELETFDLAENRDKMQKISQAPIDKLIKKGTETPEERAKLSRMRLKLQEKLKRYDEDVLIQMRKIKRGYLSDCNTAIKQTCDKYNLNVKHVKRILGQNLNS